MPVNSFDNYPLTWKPDKEKLNPPYYRSLAADLEEKIRKGLLAPGVQLPPQREIADYLDLNYTTITRVYELCREKGLIYGTVGKGTFVAPHAAEDTILTTENILNQRIDLGAVNGFSECSRLVEKATFTVVEKGYLRNLYEYSFPAGHPHQIAAGIRWMEQMGTHASIENTAIFSGVQNALTVALLSLFSSGDRIAVDRYTYPNLIELARMLNLVLVPVNGDKNGMMADELQRQCSTHRIKGIYLMSAFANPTTITIPLTRRKELADAIGRNNLILIEDDSATWLSAAKEPVIPSIFDILDGQSIYICGMTKSLCPGLRIAYMAFAGSFRQQILNGLCNINIKTSSLDAEIITEMILNGDAYRIAEQKRKMTENVCSVFASYFPEEIYASDSIGYFRWIPIQSREPFNKVENDLMARGIRVFHSDRFAVTGDGKQNYLRIALCSAGNIGRLKKGLGILKDYIRSM